MAIASSDKLVVVKAFAPGNPLPLDAREIYESLAAARSYAATSAVAYAGQTIKVVEGGVVTAYNLAPSDVEGENFTLSYAGGGDGGIQSIATSNKEGNISVVAVNGETTTTKDVPVVGALVNPVVDEDAHTLTLTKIGAESNTEVVIPLGGASPESGIVSGVAVAEDGVSLTVTTFNPETETESSANIKLTGVVGGVTAVDASVAGVLSVTTTAEDGSDAVAKQAIVGAAINPTYNAETKVLTIPVVTGVDEAGVATTSAVTVDLNAPVVGAFVDVAHTSDTEDKSAKIEFTLAGSEDKKTIYETGVRKVEAGSSVDKIKVTTAGVDGTLSAAEILIGAGSVKNPTYDSETRKITLPILQADGSEQNLEINLGKDMVVKSGSYDTVNKEIVLVLTDDSTVKIPAASLVDIYTGGATSTVSVSVSDGNVITADVKLSTVEKNILKSDENGLYVVESDFTETKGLISKAQEDAEKHADDLVGDLGESETVKAYVDAAQEAAEKHADDLVGDLGESETVKAYVDAAVDAEAGARAEKIGNVGTGSVQEYVDAAQEAAEKHADDLVGDLGESETVKAYVDAAVANAISTTDTLWVDFGAEADA